MKITLCILCSILLASCTKNEPLVISITRTVRPLTDAPAPITLKSWPYDQFVAAHLTAALRGAKMGALCPHYARVDVNSFWMAFIRATAYFESELNPNEDYTEKFPDNSGKKQVSSGLLQLSLDDAKNYATPTCKLLTPKTIHDPETNLGCGMEIMDYRLRKHPEQDAQNALGVYWSTIRDLKMLNMLKHDLPGCFL